VILCGVGKVGRRVLECLSGDRVRVVVVDLAPPADLPDGVRAVAGDCRQPAVLLQAGVRDVAGVIVCTSDDLINLAAALAIHHLAPDVRVVVRTFNPNLVERLGKAVANVVPLSVSGLVAPLLALIARTGSALGSVNVPDGPRPVVEVMVTDDSPLRGEAIAPRDVAPVALIPAAGPARYLLDVPRDGRLGLGDRVVWCGRPADLDRITAGRATDGRVRWASRLRRWARVARRTFADVEWPVKVCSAVLVAFLFLSSTLYALANRESLVDGFYHTVSIMSTGVDANPTDPFMRWYVSCLRIAGPALIAAFTAIFTNYLVRARLGGVLELRRIPDAGHVVVCGLGNVGFRVTEELLRAGQSVVVIDAAQSGRFHAAARRLGAAVMPGDATVMQVLRSARVDSARAVIAATNNDLSNVEIALLARELNAGQRVVVRLSDPSLAAMLRDSANVQLAFSLPSLAAPAFVAALYGDRVQSVFLVGGRLIAAVEVVVSAGEACLDNEPLRAVAVDFGLLPVAVTDANGRAVSDLWSHRLTAGERLTALVTLADLDRLYRRERPAPEWTVVIDAFPLSARDALPVMLQTLAGLSAAEAVGRLQQLPCEVRDGLTPGQAEDLLALLRRDRVTARITRRCGAAAR